jgi:hypothetical protein
MSAPASDRGYRSGYEWYRRWHTETPGNFLDFLIDEWIPTEADLRANTEDYWWSFKEGAAAAREEHRERLREHRDRLRERDS